MFKYSAEELVFLFAIASGVGFLTGFLPDDEGRYYLAYFIGMAITFVLGLLVLPIVHYVVKENEKEKQAEEERERIEEDKKRRIEENNKNLIRMKYIERYEKSSIIDSVSERILYDICDRIDSVKSCNDNQIKVFEKQYYFEVYRDKISSLFYEIVFYKERYEPLLEEEQRYAVANVLNEKVMDSLKAKYPTSSFYSTVQYKDYPYEFYVEHQKPMDDFNEKQFGKKPKNVPKGKDDCYKVTIYFSESNPNYVEPQQW